MNATAASHFPWSLVALIGLVAIVFLALRSATPSAPAGRPSSWRFVRPTTSDEPELEGWVVRLESAGAAPINVLKALRETCALNLSAAKQVVDQAPATVSTHGLRAAAEHVAERLRQAGAEVSIEASGERGEAIEVRLENPGEQLVNTIRLVRQVSGRGLKESKELAEAAPSVVTVCHGENELDNVRRALRAGGATVEET